MGTPKPLTIAEITQDPTHQAMLQEVGNRDAVITPTEVDADQDGYIDFNPTTASWPPDAFRKVEHTLFDKKFLSRLRPTAPSTEYANAIRRFEAPRGKPRGISGGSSP